jgi:hypothetical protein
LLVVEIGSDIGIALGYAVKGLHVTHGVEREVETALK